MFAQSKKNFIQAKLSIGPSNDRYEQEADAVADNVMNVSSSQVLPIQRKCDNCDKEELQMKPLSSSMASIIQKKELDFDTKSDSNLEASLQQSKGGGMPLSDSTQMLMNRSIGADFSNVKVHTNDTAIQMNQQLNARAFANGSDVYFNKGQYNPNSSEGKHLLAHELTHVVQQGAAINMIQKSPKCGDTWETMIRTDNGKSAVFTDEKGAKSYAGKVDDNSIEVRVTQSGENWKVECRKKVSTSSKDTDSKKVVPDSKESGKSESNTSPSTKDDQEKKSKKPKSSKKVCLTFDDGPQNGTGDVLNALGSNGVKATFFLTGQNMSSTDKQKATQKALIEKMMTAKHRIGNHTFTHSPTTKSEYRKKYGSVIDPAKQNLSTEESDFEENYNKNDAYFEKLLGSKFPGFDIARLPGDGRTFQELVKKTEAMGMKHLSWEFEFGTKTCCSWLKSKDWQGIKDVIATYDRTPKNGDVILFHDRHWNGMAGELDQLIKILKKDGFTFGLIDSSGKCS